jgi:hypothetical protein
MTPQEKAKELVLKYLRIDNNTKEWFNTHIAKQCALIAVDETLLTLNKDIRDLDVVGNVLLDLIEYWQEVKQEIEKL